MILNTKDELTESTVFKKKKYSEDDYESVIADICFIFQKSGKVDFSIEGFNDFKNLSCDCDLMCLMEVMPSVLLKISNDNYNFNILFYEQGTERDLRFSSVSKNEVKIEYYDLFGKPSGSEAVIINAERLKQIFVNFNSKFVKIGSILCPYLMENLI